MDVAALLARGGPARATRAALIGVGEFGRTLLAQSRRIPQLELAVLCDLDVDRLKVHCLAAGVPEDALTHARDARAAAVALERGATVLTDDPDLAIAMPVDVVVEATGNAQAGAANAVRALSEGRHLVLVTKETDCLVGPLLSERARAAGLTLSQVDGDQPSLLLALLARLSALGLRVVAAGKASEHDIVLDAGAGEAHAVGLPHRVTADPALWGAAGSFAGRVAARAAALAALPQRTPPDFCELCLVANASGLTPDRPDLHAPIARMVELPSILRPAAAGGILTDGAALDVFNCLRRPDDLSAAGGVFAVVEAPDEATGRLLATKGLPASEDGRFVLVHNPVHLLGVEAPLSILSAHRLGLSTGAQTVRPVSDVTMVAERNFAAGETLADRGHHHRVDGIAPRLTPYAALADAAPVPYFLALGARLTRDVAAGAAVRCADVALPDGPLITLRREQDKRAAARPDTAIPPPLKSSDGGRPAWNRVR